MKDKQTAKVTINEVAAHAGVSKSTVSRYINGKIDAISPKKVKSIKKAIEELNYRPSQMAQGLKVKKSKVIGFLVADITNPFSVATLRGVEEVCDQYGYSIMVCNTDNSPEKEREMLHKLNAHYIEGLIINTTGRNNDVLLDLISQDVSIVLVDRKVPGLKIDAVTTNNREVTSQIVNLMYDKGYAQVGLFTEPIKGISPREERASAYTEIALERNAGGTPLVYEADVKDKESLLQSVKSFLEMKEGKKAILGSNGLLMLKIISCLYELGISIPEDVGIAGFDDTEWYKLIGPGITTIAQPSHEMGRVAMERIIKRIEGDESAPQTIQLEAELVLRQSL
ncbi:LacI family DNA-binding transcriptional regulator [Bacillus licheniformis]|uniref:LacI family DNA-binding transcriptional regulator n=1 Tax=Bacillus licheniformis TaxID=1402 RepID=UPI0005CE0716|nr:LacI family DNA-binding transcriptional regulator [Bacillus licheniformis]KJE33047.1 helix-turn-helix family protein [Bacillus licheniformis]MBA1163060.1 LacI family DNA-binding transcriptional regulator [Bacillus licheniformis]MBW7633892.1 LacI family DNA-binding transcriptional regulator [Bacillus licheniformis]OAZ62206.1 putative HTH-type transcriptional regulator EndR [Bacillus licheniformis]TWM88876.1 HTH-type transcriptional regulator KdgR [Bacillus licheniformis]